MSDKNLKNAIKSINHLAVIIPAYNSSPFLAETIEAILSQTYLPDEIIVIDDGSTDNTFEIAASFGGIVRCYRTENGGQGKARKYAIQKTTAEWIALCDSDDIWNKDHLERRLLLIENYPDTDFTFSDCYSFGPDADPRHSLLREAPQAWAEKWLKQDENGFYVIAEPFSAFLKFNPAYPSGMVFRRKTYLKMGGFKEKYSRWIGEDSEFTRRFSSLEKVCFVGDSKTTWGYRRHAGNYSRVQWKNINAKAEILFEHLTQGVVPSQFVKDTEIEMYRTRVRAFDQAFWEKNFSAAMYIYPLIPADYRSLTQMGKNWFSSLYCAKNDLLNLFSKKILK